MTVFDDNKIGWHTNLHPAARPISHHRILEFLWQPFPLRQRGHELGHGEDSAPADRDKLRGVAAVGVREQAADVVDVNHRRKGEVGLAALAQLIEQEVVGQLE